MQRKQGRKRQYNDGEILKVYQSSHNFSSYFLQFARNKTSQHGEDGIIEHILSLIGIAKRPYCVDIGAWDGKHWSNSYSLVYENKWSGLLIEGNEVRCNDMRCLYHDRSDVHCIHQMVELEGYYGINEVLERHQVPNSIDFLTIDIDGADYHVWNTMNDKYRSRLVCIEFNPTIPNNILYCQPRNMNIHKGSSLRALWELGKKFKYTLVATTIYNAFFVANELIHLLPSSSIDISNDLDKLHIPSMQMQVFQTYDGELKYSGTKKLLWHNIAINPERLQVLPKKKQIFPFAPPNQNENAIIISDLNHFITMLKNLCESCSVTNDEYVQLLNKLLIDFEQRIVVNLENAIKQPCLHGIIEKWMKHLLDELDYCIFKEVEKFSAVFIVKFGAIIHVKVATLFETYADSFYQSTIENSKYWYMLSYYSLFPSDICWLISTLNCSSRSKVEFPVEFHTNRLVLLKRFQMGLKLMDSSMLLGSTLDCQYWIHVCFESLGQLQSNYHKNVVPYELLEELRWMLYSAVGKNLRKMSQQKFIFERASNLVSYVDIHDSLDKNRKPDSMIVNTERIKSVLDEWQGQLFSSYQQKTLGSDSNQCSASSMWNAMYVINWISTNLCWAKSLFSNHHKLIFLLSGSCAITALATYLIRLQKPYR